MKKDNRKKTTKRGLENLFSGDLSQIINEIENNNASEYVIHEILLSNIIMNPYQPRMEFDQAKLSELEQSIEENGLINPIILAKDDYSDDTYILIAGERRYRAFWNLKKLTIKSIILQNVGEEKLIQLSLIENNQRENLTSIEEANGYKIAMTRMNLTQEALAKKLGKNRSDIANSLRLLNLSEDIQKLLSDKKLSKGHGKILASLNSEKANKMAKEVALKKLSVRALSEKLAKNSDNFDNKKLEKKIETVVLSKVSIDNKKIAIFYHGKENMKNILSSLGIKWD